MKTLLQNCDILADTDAQPRFLRQAYLGIDGAYIRYIGGQPPAEHYDRTISLSHRLLLPGLVNCHGHAAMVLLRGLGGNLPLDQWLARMFALEARMRPEDIRAGSEAALMEMLRTGTTSFSDMYLFPETMAECAASAGIKANLCEGVTEFDPDALPENNRDIQNALRLYERWHGRADDRIRVDFGIHAEYTSTEPVVRAVAEACAERNGRIQLHLSETDREHAACVARRGKTPAQWFADLGVFRSPTAAAHCVAVTQDDLHLLRRCGVMPVHNPTSNLKLGSGTAPVVRMQKEGMTVALGTDGAASNNNLNMFEELHIASILHNGVLKTPDALLPLDCIRMATVNGARLQGRPDTGVLSVGKKADIIALNTDAPHLYPLLDPLEAVCYSAQGSDVCMTMVDGKILYRDGQYDTLDEESIRYRMKKSVDRLFSAIGEDGTGGKK